MTNPPTPTPTSTSTPTSTPAHPGLATSPQAPDVNPGLHGDTRVGVVVIGRNEGERLVTCLQSVLGSGPVVYVDSGSTDASVAAAREMGVEVVELDTGIPFTAARGRNAGWRRLVELHPRVRYIQFVDGDTEVDPAWLDAAAAALESDEGLAAVCGRRRERRPEASVYNRLADMEWDTPVGEARACGGDAMYRREALEMVDAFDDSLICGEEPEMCVRLRGRGWKVRRLDREMTLHDADMHRFSQWWKRSVRGGWAYAQGAAMHGSPPERHNVKRSRSVWFWGLIFPLLCLSLAWFTWGASVLLMFVGYGVLGWRVYRYRRRTRGDSPRLARVYAFFTVLAKFPEMLGQVRYLFNRWSGKRAELIEYKAVSR